jgi:hypothetical protein
MEIHSLPTKQQSNLDNGWLSLSSLPELTLIPAAPHMISLRYWHWHRRNKMGLKKRCSYNLIIRIFTSNRDFYSYYNVMCEWLVYLLHIRKILSSTLGLRAVILSVFHGFSNSLKTSCRIVHQTRPLVDVSPAFVRNRSHSTLHALWYWDNKHS